MEARNSTDLRLDGTTPAVVAEGLGKLATYALVRFRRSQTLPN